MVRIKFGIMLGTVALAIWCGLMPYGLAQSGNSIKRLSPEAASALLQDADSVKRLTAEAKILLDATPSSRTWGQYCGDAWRLSEQGEFRLAVRAASMALFIGQSEGNSTALAFAKRDLAVAYSYSGNLDAAEKLASESIAHNAQNYADVWSVSYKTLGDIATRRGDYAKAIEHYRKADNYSSVTWRRWLRVSLANALMLAGRMDEAQVQYRDVSSYSQSPIRELVQRLAGEMALRQSKPDEAIKLFREYGQAVKGDDGAYHQVWALDGEARALLAKGDPQSAAKALLQATLLAENLRARFRSEEIKTGMFGEMEDVFARAVLVQIEIGDHLRAFEIAEAARGRALSDQVRGRVQESAFAKTAGIAVARNSVDDLKSIGATETLVTYFTTLEQTLAWVSDRAGMRVVRLAVSRDQLRQDVQRLRAAIVDRSPQVRERGARLYDVLVKPLGLAADSRLIVVPHDALHHLPFQALWTGERYLVQQHAISYAPSVASIALTLRNRNASRPMQIVAFGNPDLGSDTLSLPGAEREVNNIKAAYPATLTFLRAEATKPRFVAEASKHSMVHIAAHAEFDALDPLYSRVRFAPENGVSGSVEAHEIYKLNLAGTSLVTLSACESGMSRITRGDEIWGFTRSFLAAGAPALVLSLWPVADESTEKIMTTFYKEMREVNPREAIRRAQLEVSRDPRFEHPYFWAPFNLIGDWR